MDTGDGLIRPNRFSWFSKKTSKRPSGVDRLGLFADLHISAGELVARKGGHLVDGRTLGLLAEPLYRTHMQVGQDQYLAATVHAELDSIMLAINHSCEPNVRLTGYTDFVTLVDIEPDSEILVDYACIAPLREPLNCFCSSASCRSQIGVEEWKDPRFYESRRPQFSTYLLRLADRHHKLNPED